MAGQPIIAFIEIHSHFQGLELHVADSSNTDSSLPVDLWIGSDYYEGWRLGMCAGEQMGPLQFIPS